MTFLSGKEQAQAYTVCLTEGWVTVKISCGSFQVYEIKHKCYKGFSMGLPDASNPRKRSLWSHLLVVQRILTFDCF